MKRQPTPGGNRLRALREFHGKTQLDVELDASLGIGYLQRLELGRVQQPERDTLDRILSALNAHYTEKREILELFGYVVNAPLPTLDDIEWAISVCQAELESAVFPAYLLDCGHRLLFWNDLVPHLLDTSLAKFPPAASYQSSMLKYVFDADYGLTERVENGDVFFPAQIRALRYEMQRFHDEEWYEALIDDMLGCDKFRQYWNTEKSSPVHIPARPLTPLIMQVDGIGVLNFRLISESFVQDHRFRVIFYIPSDPKTIQQCLNWLAEGENIAL